MLSCWQHGGGQRQFAKGVGVARGGTVDPEIDDVMLPGAFRDEQNLGGQCAETWTCTASTFTDKPRREANWSASWPQRS